MKSPFPGMDPYLEHPAVRADFHASFLAYFREVITAKLPDHYFARLEEQIRLVDAPPVESSDYRPDVSITRNPVTGLKIESPNDIALLEPTEVLPLGEPILEEVRDLRIDLLRWPDEELITTIELLSPWNKSGDGYGDFQRKRRAMLSRGVNWVEIDFLIAGERSPSAGRPHPRIIAL